MKQGFLTCVGLAVALHAGWLLSGWLAPRPPAASQRQLPLAASTIRAIETRTVPRVGGQLPTGATAAAVGAEASLPEETEGHLPIPKGKESIPPPPEAGAPAEQAEERRLSEVLPESEPRPQLDVESAPSPDPAPEVISRSEELPPPAESSVSAEAGSAEEWAAQTPSTPGDPGAETAGFDPATYLRRSQLTRAPQVQTPVALSYPLFEDDTQGHYTAILALFIDETGRVQRIRVEPPGLPDALEGAARRAFLATRFTPGEVEGRPVRSLIRIEVQFDRGDTTPE